MQRRVIKTMCLLIGASMILAGSYSFAQGKGSPVKAFQWTPKATELRLAMRSLWQDHIFWVRNVVLTTKLGDMASAKVEEEQVVQNAKEIANAVIPY